MILKLSKFRNTVGILTVIFLFIAAVCFGQDRSDNGYAEIHKVGKQIAEGVSQSIVMGLAVADPELKYSLEAKKNSFTYQGRTWPIIDIFIDTESRKLGNNKITFVLLMEVDQSSQVIVGTVKNIRVNGNPENNFSILNNTMYVETEEGTEQVQIVNGQMHFVE